MLEVDKVSSYYGDFQALHEVSLRVSDGEFIVAFGPNGHGKSTLLKTICGLQPATSGSIKYNGAEITGLSPLTLWSKWVLFILLRTGTSSRE